MASSSERDSVSGIPNYGAYGVGWQTANGNTPAWRQLPIPEGVPIAHGNTPAWRQLPIPEGAPMASAEHAYYVPMPLNPQLGEPQGAFNTVPPGDSMSVAVPPPPLPVPVPYSAGIAAPPPNPVRMSTWAPQHQVHSIGNPDRMRRDSESTASESISGSVSERSDDEVGCLTLPVSKLEAERLIEYARKSPYGKGTQTIVDESVRRTWEIDAKDITIASQLPAQKLNTGNSPQWDRWLDDVLTNVKKGLGMKASSGVRAELYKLLIYGEGAHFKPHRDTEKAPGMIGTMVIGLPSEHEGGDIRLLHEDQERRYSTSAKSKSGFSCAAWYSDVLHEVQPVTSGYRVVLTYNLIATTPQDEAVSALVNGDQELTELVEGYAQAAENNKRLPSEMIYRLGHKYTETSLDIDKLRPSDREIVTRMQNAAKRSCKLYLALLEREHEGGTAEGDEPDFYDSYYDEHVMSEDEDEDDADDDSSNDDGDDDDNDAASSHGQSSQSECLAEHEIVCTISRSTTLQNVHEVGGEFLVDKIEASSKSFVQNIYKNRAPDEEDWSGYTGNEGCNATDWYHDSVLVLIPNKFALTFTWGPHLENAADALPATLDRLVSEIQAGDSELLSDLTHVCDVAIHKELDNKAYMAKTAYPSRKQLSGETKGSLAKSCAMMGNLKLFQLAMTLFDRHVPVTAYEQIGEMFEFRGEDSTEALKCIKNACSRIVKNVPDQRTSNVYKLGKKETTPPPHQLFGAFHGFCESFKATHPAADERVVAFAASGMDLVVESFAADLSQAYQTALHDQDGAVLIRTLSVYKREDLETRVLEKATLLTSYTGPAITMLGEALKANRQQSQNFISSKSFTAVFEPWFDDFLEHFDVCHGFQDTCPRRWNGREHEDRLNEYCPSEVVIKSYDDRARALAALFGECLQAPGVEEERLLVAVVTGIETRLRPEHFRTFAIPFLTHLLNILEENHLQHDSHGGRYQRVFQRVINVYMQKYVGTRPYAPADWTREMVNCPDAKCDCPSLNAFLSHPTQKTARFQMGDRRRKHLSSKLASRQYEERTEYSAKPYTLVITKTKKDYEDRYREWSERVKCATACIASFDVSALRNLLRVPVPDNRPLSVAELQILDASHRYRRPLEPAEGRANARPLKRAHDHAGDAHRPKKAIVDIIDLT